MTGERERLAQHDPGNVRGVGELLDPSTFNLETEVPAAVAAGSGWMAHYGDQAGEGDPVVLPPGPDFPADLPESLPLRDRYAGSSLPQAPPD
jgi:hypothetical protein